MRYPLCNVARLVLGWSYDRGRLTCFPEVVCPGLLS